MAVFEVVEPMLYGDPIVVVIQALLHAMRDEVELGRTLVKTWRTKGPSGFKTEHFKAVIDIVGVAPESSLKSLNEAVGTWLLHGKNKHVPASFAVLYERYFIESCFDDPLMLSMQGLLDSVGIRGHNREQSDFSEEAAKRHAQYAECNLELLQDLTKKMGGVPTEEKASICTLEWLLENTVSSFSYFYHPYALDQMSGYHLMFFMMMSETPVRSVSDGWNYVQRLRALPKTAQTLCEKMKTQKAKGIVPPAFIVEKVGQQIDSILSGDAGVLTAPKESPAYVILLQKFTEAEDGAGLEAPEDLRTALELAITVEVADGYKALRETWRIFEEVVGVEGYKDHSGVGALPDGEAYYAMMLANSTTSDMTPAEVHQLGLDQVKEIMTELEEVIVRLAETDEALRGDASVVKKVQELRKLPQWLYPFTEDDQGTRTFPQESKDACLVDYRQMVEDIEKIISPFFDVRPNDPCKVEPVPPHMEDGTPAAFYLPGSFDGSRNGTFYVNLSDMMAQWKSFMKVLMAHEGIPGHHFQIALQQEMKTLPFFRRDVQGFTAFVEGWALYTELLARELGYFKAEDGTEGYDLLGYFAANLLRAARCVVDTGLHHFGWSKEQAVEYMMANTFEDPGSVNIEVERYCATPGQATAYKVGALRILQLREKLKEEQGEAFDLIKFHRLLLSAGAVPLSMLPDIAASA